MSTRTKQPPVPDVSGNREHVTPPAASRRSVRLAWLFGVLAAVLLLLLAAVLVLPSVVEAKISSMLGAMTRGGNVEFRIRGVGLFRTDLACTVARVSPGGRRMPVASIDNLAITYSPFGLLRGRLKTVEATGAGLLAAWKNDALSVPAVELFRDVRAENAASSVPSDPVETLNHLVDSLPLDSFTATGNVMIDADGELVFLPYSAKFVKNGPKEALPHLEFHFRTAHSSNHAEVRGKYFYRDGKLSLQLKTNTATQSLPLLLRSQLPSRVRGSLRTDATASYDLRRREIDALSVHLKSQVSLRRKAGGIDASPELSLVQKKDRSYELTLSGVSGVWDGLPMTLDSFELAASPEKAEGSCRISVGHRAAFPLRFSCRRTETGRYAFDVNLTDAASDQLISYRNAAAAFRQPFFTLSGTGGRDGVEAKVRLAAQDIALRHELGTAGIAGLTVSGSGRLTFGETPIEPVYSGSVELTDVSVQGFDCTASLPSIRVDTLSAGGAVPDVRLRADGVSVQVPKAKLRAEQISLDLPLSRPENAPVTVGRLVWNGHPAGIFSGSARLDGTTLFLTGGGVLPVQRYTLESRTGFSAAGFFTDNHVDFPKQKLVNSAGLHELFPEWKAFQADGEVAASVAFRMESGKMSGGFRATVADGMVSNPELGLTVEGLALDFSGDLPSMTSPAAQKLSFRSMTYNDFRIGATEALFRMDSPTSWIVEHVLAHWCGGKVRLESTRFAAGAEKTDLTLHCDRLGLAEFLRQTGLGPMQGKGAVSGTIPLTLKKGTVQFHDGFLYSTPGETGELRGVLNETLAPDAGPVEMALAQEALRDFTYAWTRIYLNSDRENMKLTLQFDGKPTRPLYFEYNELSGGFVRSKTAHRFQGIRLDVNINVQLDKAMKLVACFKDLFHKK